MVLLFLTFAERDIAQRVTDQYYDQSYKVDYLGIGKYDLINIDHHKKVTNCYVLNEWEASGPAMFGVAYGYDQPIVYKNLCKAFGKEKVDRIW